MSSTPRIHIDERAQKLAGITDPLPMFAPGLVEHVRRAVMLAFQATALDRAQWDALRVAMAEQINCGVCRNMRDISAERRPAHGEADPLIALGKAFHGAAPEQAAGPLADTVARYGEAAAAEALLGPIFGGFHAKVIVTCGLEPADASELTNTRFDASKYTLETGALGALSDDNA